MKKYSILPALLIAASHRATVGELKPAAEAVLKTWRVSQGCKRHVPIADSTTFRSHYYFSLISLKQSLLVEAPRFRDLGYIHCPDGKKNRASQSSQAMSEIGLLAKMGILQRLSFFFH